MRKVVAILGTNASGKSDLGIRLAAHFGGEIVSADSRQVYRGLDLGSGKITKAQAEAVPHHLIDVVDVCDRFDLARYQAAAYAAIDRIHDAGKLPFLVGGTGLYISAIVEGYLLVEESPEKEFREDLEKRSVVELASILTELDPEAASHVDKSNSRRLVRAIEVATAGHSHSVTRRNSPRYDVLQLGLTWERSVLDARINARLADRFANGMIEEVAALREQGIPDARLDALGLEYRFILHYLRGEIPSKEALAEQLGIAIRQFSRRQISWFKRNRNVVWLDTTGDYFQQARFLIDAWL